MIRKVTKALIIAFFVLQLLILLSSAFGDYSDRTFYGVDSELERILMMYIAGSMYASVYFIPAAIAVELLAIVVHIIMRVLRYLQAHSRLVGRISRGGQMTRKRLELVEGGNGWSIWPEDLLLSQVSIDYQLKMAFWSKVGSCEVIIRMPFLFETADSQKEINPENTADLMPVILLLRRNATRIAASQSGHLRVDFADGASIQVAPDDKYEAWRIVTESGGLAIARPGGDVDFWDSRLPDGSRER